MASMSWRVMLGISSVLPGELIRQTSCLPEAVPIAQSIPEAVIANDDEISRMIYNRIGTAVQAETNKQIKRAQTDIISTSEFEYNKYKNEVEKSHKDLKNLIILEVGSKAKEQVTSLLRTSHQMQKIIDNHILEVESKVDEKCRDILDRIIDEEKYQTIDEALRRSLEKKIDNRINNSLLTVLIFNSLLVGGFIVSRMAMKK
mmetsp:Transcript_7888/g.10200  ORF Transcript_7888/g.10200 Transcript_7888/m.10200 type:complete len:202 (+) Transcript_7888:31-636(+)|eukprot:CAMPEP_0114334494 /NCGR_PEP_ID=MMETSP0101-20121206/4411_1 /TAXON_ID=38822 ORGANISM="Pteridomonas danica, Strain PT" /NCGR_SAMPLE_ID=MMETSP0101 /ASSEMBLY_ACC=CAM_ASM_000211 /LENGTH=201 /DNA_ID=CAMNT_0001465769 /DNA_START=16 /DNA_END=621 /DNA_ORIENTATION=-